MKRLIYLLTALMISQNVLAQSPFITRWDLSKPSGSGLTQISFGVGTTGTVSYTWAEVGGTATGSGTFSGSTATITGLPAGGKIDLSISPTNFNQININGATDRVRLIEIKQWGTTAWANMVTAFYGCFNMTLTATDVPNTSAVTDMSYMFGYCSIFNQALPIGFNTSNVTNMSGMFHSCTAYNQALPASINTSAVTDMSFMFYDCDSYNKALPIGFNTTNVVTMLSMFHGCRSYNQALPTNFNTSAVIDMRFMFNGCTSYNQALPNSFNTAKVTGMRNMFNGCTTFNQSLASFTLNPNVDLMNVLNNTALSVTNYDATLTAFRNSGITGRTMGAAGLNYCAAETDRTTLTSTMGWTITDAGKWCPTLTIGTATNPTTCSGSDGKIAFTTSSITAGSQTLSYKKDGVATTANVTIASNAFELTGLGSGDYSDFAIGAVTATGSTTLADPAKPTFTVGTAVKPTTCNATDGNLPLNDLANSTSYSVSYQKDGGTAVVQTLNSNASGVLTISNVGVGSYTNIKVTLNNCESATATASIAAPSFNITAGSPTQPSTCNGTGSIPFTTSLPTGTYIITYKKDGTAATASVNVASGAFNLFSIGAGSYSDFKIVHGGCDVTTSGAVTLTDPMAPTAFSVTGGGSFCTGGTGVAVGLSSSQTDVNYQLKLGSNNVGGPVAGSGGAISFGNQTATGTYTVMAIHSATLCSTTMTGNATINTFSLPQASISGNATVCKDNTPVLLSFTATIGPAPYIFSYKINNGATQILNSSSATANLPQATNVAGVFVYSLVSVQDGNGCSQTQNGSVTVNVLTKPVITLTTLQQALNEGNSQTFCDTDGNPVNSLQFDVSGLCVVGSPVWRVQVGSGAWSAWSSDAPVSQLSNNQPHRYQAACDATCPNTYTSPIELTINYRASVPQNVSMTADGTTVGAGAEKSICDQSGTGLTFSATCGAGERLLYSVDGGDYLPTVPSQIVDGQFHNYRVRCQKLDGTPSCVETDSGVMKLKISVISVAPVVSLNVSSGCGTPTNFSGTTTCAAGFVTVWYNAATNVALPSLPATTPTETTSYYARCQNEVGCQSGNSNTVTYTVLAVNEAPVVMVSSELVCTGQEVTVSTSCPVGSTVLWNTGVSESSFKVSFNNITTQSYMARCVFGNGCQSAQSAAKTVRWKAFELTIINIGQSQSAVKSNDRAAWASQFVTPDGGPILDQSSQSNPTLYYSENLNKIAPRYWTVHVDACALGTGGSLTFDMLVTPETGVPQSFNTHENNMPYFMYANRDGWAELYAQNHPSYGFYQANGAGGNVYDAGLPKGLYKLGVRYWDMKGWGSIYPSTRKAQGNVLAYQEYWFRIQSKDGVGVGAARTAEGSVQGSGRGTANGEGQATNVPPLGAKGLAILPNPVTSTLRLQVQDSKGQVVETTLTDASGRSVLSRQFVPETNTHQEEFGVSELPTGMYFLQVNAGDKQATLKVVKVD
ncbi:BspA family leucine-rich repeat surface protein [Runella limosa]|uniref:BspA family leucine-rich repeat surface protein n=1 Tax=Runella limosa TaxID=370978 RepID=UPI00040674A2|nr:BspA family leucine-rich repeat surface protein [Runella limosa]